VVKEPILENLEELIQGHHGFTAKEKGREPGAHIQTGQLGPTHLLHPSGAMAVAGQGGVVAEDHLTICGQLGVQLHLVHAHFLGQPKGGQGIDAQGEPREQQDEVVGLERSAAGLSNPQLQLHWVGATSYLHGALQPDAR
jgi:hypothetical protein